MAEIRLKIELNKGRLGIPIERLAKVAEEVEKFVAMFADDMHLGKGEWIAHNFKNESVDYDVTYIGEAPDSMIRVGLKAISHLADPKTTPDDLGFGVRRETLLQFARIASHIDADDSVGIGIYNGKPEPKMHELSKKRYIEIEKQINQTVVQYGGLQGEITTLFKESNKLWIREHATGVLVSCQFPPHMYGKVWQLLEAKDSFVNVEGWITQKNGVIDHLKVEVIEPAAAYKEGDLEKFFGADPNFTGGQSVDKYLDKLRGDSADEYLESLADSDE
jgi:hypothetical protein